MNHPLEIIASIPNRDWLDFLAALLAPFAALALCALILWFRP